MDLAAISEKEDKNIGKTIRPALKAERETTQ